MGEGSLADGTPVEPTAWSKGQETPLLVLAPTSPPGLGVLAHSLRVITRGLWIVYSSLTTLFAHLIGSKPVACVTNCVAIWLLVSSGAAEWCSS